MTQVLWVVTGVLLTVIAALCLKIHLLRKGARELAQAFAERLAEDSNTLIDLSTRDRVMRRLAAAINEQLRLLRRQRQKYLHGDRELKEAVSNISHDLRTPLTAICGYLELLEQEPQSAQVRRYLDQIRNRTQALRQLTEELFRYSVLASVQQQAREPVNLCRALEESLAASYGMLTQRGICPHVTLPEQPVVRQLDGRALGRVLENVLSNACKYSDGDLEVCLTPQGSISFENAAAELTPLLAARLFDRFYTVQTGRDATGLGLSIAKLLTERMGGTVRAEYQNGRLRITLAFPE